MRKSVTTALLDFVPDGRQTDADETMSEAILELLQRRPHTVDDTAGSLHLQRMEAVRHLDGLHRRGLVKRRRAGNRIFYYPTGEEPALVG